MKEALREGFVCLNAVFWTLLAVVLLAAGLLQPRAKVEAMAEEATLFMALLITTVVLAVWGWASL